MTGTHPFSHTDLGTTRKHLESITPSPDLLRITKKSSFDATRTKLKNDLQKHSQKFLVTPEKTHFDPDLPKKLGWTLHEKLQKFKEQYPHPSYKNVLQYNLLVKIYNKHIEKYHDLLPEQLHKRIDLVPLKNKNFLSQNERVSLDFKEPLLKLRGGADQPLTPQQLYQQEAQQHEKERLYWQGAERAWQDAQKPYNKWQKSQQVYQNAQTWFNSAEQKYRQEEQLWNNAAKQNLTDEQRQQASWRWDSA